MAYFNLEFRQDKNKVTQEENLFCLVVKNEYALRKEEIPTSVGLRNK